ncbi:MAG: peptide chain release factor N(5)-glutamine methyltransferase, partial [Bacteroidota bacterium]|nr:peptide chain release factor N(5)-glutamine methyltransferase [Bacteroidota bacterium]
MTVDATAKKVWTILDLINWGTNYFTEKGFDEARLSVELLIAHVLKLQRIQLYTNFDKPLADEELTALKELIKRRLQHEPLQYITGETEFMGLKFSVDPRVLIPRPETELLVEQVIERTRNTFGGVETVRILDVGSGSGCIAVSLAKLISNVHVTAIDISKDALEVAKANAERNGV